MRNRGRGRYRQRHTQPPWQPHKVPRGAIARQRNVAPAKATTAPDARREIRLIGQR